MKLAVPEQRMLYNSLSDLHKSKFHKCFMEHAVDEMKGNGMCGSGIMTGKGFLDSLKSFTKKASMYAEKYGLPILKSLGPTILKEILVPLAKSKLGLGINIAGRGKKGGALKLSGQGKKGGALRLAGQYESIPSVARAKPTPKKRMPKKM